MPFSSKEINDSLFRQIFESGMIGLLFTTFEGKIIEANDAFLGFIGYSRKDLEKGLIDWIKITPPEFMPITDQAIHNLKTKGISPPYEKEYFRKDGSRVQLLMGSVRVKNTTHYDNMTYAINISTRKKFEQELAMSREQLEERVRTRTKDLSETNSFLQSLIENIPNMIFVKDANDLKFVRFNKAGEELLGINRADMIGKSDYDFFPKEEAEFFIQKDRNVLEKKMILDIPEEPITTKKGTRILHTKKIPLVDANNQAKYLLGISEDITDIKRAEAERLKFVREQAAREEAEINVARLEILGDASTILTSSLEYESTLKNFYDFMISRMADWVHITIYKNDEDDNPEFVFETSAIDPEISLATKENRWKLIRDIDEAINSNSDQKNIFLKLKKSGFKSIINVPLKVRGNNLGRILLARYTNSTTLFSITDMQLAEELAERASLAIDNARLFSEARKANQLKDEFLATLSHELRTPLNIIHGYSELLKKFSDKMTDREKFDSIDAIHRNAVEQSNIVNDILDVSRIITGKMSVNLTLQTPTEIILSVAKNSVKMAEFKNIKLISETPKTPIYIMMDSTRIQQIIWNLVSNAIKFTIPGGEIKIKNYLENKTCVIEVQDTGIGIASSFLPHIFERFRQEDGSMTRKYGGLGLGLAIVRHLVEMHGGTVEAQSDGKDKGSKFLVKIPIVPTPQKPTVISPPTIPENALENVRILLVEDSRDNRLLITRLLSNYGAEVQEAESAIDARKCLKNFKPDVILCDIGMPDEDGLEFIKRLRKTDATPSIALTAYARDEERAQFLGAGFQAHVTKPVSIQTLLREIKKLI
ncbi:MAG: PAS domain S-box protein [Bdellovibrionota bacterium]